MGWVQNIVNRISKPPQGTAVTPIDQQKLLSLMMANSGPQETRASAFSPGSPILPTPGITLPSGPRTWTFPIGYNIGQLPRSTESTSFDTLRNLASLYDAVMLCEQSWYDLCSRLELEIKPTPEALEDADGDASRYAKDISTYKAFFEVPDPDEDLDLHNWLIKALREQLELDALAIYVQPNRGGGVHGLNIVDGSTVKPLITDRGRKPAPPYPAYQQFWHGAPLGWYTSDQIIYHRETQRADSVYGLSRVERIILRVNQALRKQNKDLSYFTEGNLPLGILKMPETDTNEWTPDEVLTFQRIWDGLLGGNDKMRSRLKVIPPGSEYDAVESQDDLMTKFDLFLLNTSVAAFGLTMAELGFTENVNKSSGDSQENVTYRRAMRPLMNRYAKLFTFILRKYFKETRFIVTWKGYEETEDLKTQADAYGNLTSKGLLTIQDANRLMGLPYQEKEPIPRFVLTPTGPVFFEDLLDPEVRKAQKDAQMAGFELAKQNPGTKPGDKPQKEGNTENGQPNSNNGNLGGSSHSSSSTVKPGTDQEEGNTRTLRTGRGGRDTDPLQDGTPGGRLHPVEPAPGALRAASREMAQGEEVNDAEQQTDATCGSSPNEHAAPNTPARATTDTQVPLTATRQTDGLGALAANEARPDAHRQSDADAAKADYRRWRERAIADVKAGRAPRDFATTLIPVPIHTAIADSLSRCTTPDAVKRVFERAKEADSYPKVTAADSGGVQVQSKSDWRPKW